MSRFFTRSYIGLLLTTQLVFSIPVAQAQLVLFNPGNLTPDPFPQVARAYWVQADIVSPHTDLATETTKISTPSSNVLWARQPDLRLPPASLTKLMTALLVVESSTAKDVVTVDAATKRETGTRLGLRPGEQYSVEDLLAATLIHSANDACHALSAHIAGSESHFVARMNRRARELGLKNTRFTNACGHDAQGHYSSARDLAALAQRVLHYPRLLSLIDRTEMSITAMTATPTMPTMRNTRRSFLLKTTNALLGRYDGVLGMKTGYTPKAGKCLIAYAIRGQRQVLLVMLNAPNRWWDAVDILDLAFSHVEHPS